jgi:DNA-binding beta-propeller fold protein YncE
MAAFPQLERLIVANYGDLNFIDLRSGRVVQRLKFPHVAYEMVADASTGRLYVTDDSNGVSIVDVEGGRLLDRKELGTELRDIQLSPDGTRLYVADGPGKAIQVLDVGDLSLTERISVPAPPQLIAVDPSGKQLFVSHKRSVSAIPL